MKQSNNRGKYYITHKSKIKDSVKTSLSNIKSGHIVKIKYKSEYRSSTKESIYLIIQPNYNRYLWVYDLDYFNPSDWPKLLRNTKDGGTRLQNIGKTSVTWLDFGKENKSLYTFLKNLIKEGFRQLSLNPSHLQSLEILRYDLGIPETIQSVEDQHSKVTPTKEKVSETKDDK